VLGGRRPECLDVADLWQLAVSDGGFLEEWAVREVRDRQRHAWLSTARLRLRREGIQDLLPRISLTRALRMADVLIELPHTFLDRAAVTLVADLIATRKIGRSDAWPHVYDAIRLRARRSFIRSLEPWKDHTKLGALVPFQCWVAPIGEPHVDGLLDGKSSRVELLVGADWLVDIWGRGLGTVGGHLVVSVDPTKAIADTDTGSCQLPVQYLGWTPSTSRSGLEASLCSGTAIYDAGAWRLA